MLKFIRPDSRCGLLQQRISKHLMLKFIFAGTGWRCESSHFKTSHVKVYPLPTFYNYLHSNFKTSHIKVYPNAFPVFHTVHYIRFLSIYQHFKIFYQPPRHLPKKFTKSPQCHCFCGFTQFCTDRRLVNFHCITKSTAHHFPYPSFQAPPRQTHFH